MENIENYFETIRTATAPDATDDARSAGRYAARAILVALDTKAGEAVDLAPNPENAKTSPAPDIAMPIIQLISMLKGVPPDKLIDFAIAKLQAKVGDATPVQVTPVKFRLIPLPEIAR